MRRSKVEQMNVFKMRLVNQLSNLTQLWAASLEVGMILSGGSFVWAGSLGSSLAESRRPIVYYARFLRVP